MQICTFVLLYPEGSYFLKPGCWLPLCIHCVPHPISLFPCLIILYLKSNSVALVHSVPTVQSFCSISLISLFPCLIILYLSLTLFPQSSNHSVPIVQSFCSLSLISLFPCLIILYLSLTLFPQSSNHSVPIVLLSSHSVPAHSVRPAEDSVCSLPFLHSIFCITR